MKICFYSLLLAGVLAGCTKTKELNDYAVRSNVLMIPDSNWPGAYLIPSDSVFVVGSEAVDINLYARLSFAIPTGPVEVFFQKDAAALAAYNEFWLTEYQMLPDSCYESTSLRSFIPSGDLQTSVSFKIFPEKVDPGIPYMLAFSLAGEADIRTAANFKSIVIPIRIEN